MPKTSAGLLPYRTSTTGGIDVFIAHPGGPFWARRDEGAWSIVKGEFDPQSESPQSAAGREFAEEIGVDAPDGPWIDLGAHKQKSGKVVVAFAVQADELAFVESGEFDLEWPPRSGRTQRFPEVDRAEWIAVDVARGKLVSGQVPVLDRLLQAIGAAPSTEPSAE